MSLSLSPIKGRDQMKETELIEAAIDTNHQWQAAEPSAIVVLKQPLKEGKLSSDPPHRSTISCSFPHCHTF